MQKFIIVPILSALLLRSIAVPIDAHDTDVGFSTLHKRRTCAGGGQAPCICPQELGLRVTSNTLAGRCQEIAFLFKDKASETDGTLIEKKPFSKSDRSAAANPVPQCDHIIELQVIADVIEKSEERVAACKKFATKAIFTKFREAINSEVNTVFLEATVNNAKGTFISGGTSQDGKAAAGVVSYLTLLKNGDPSLQDKAVEGVTAALTEILQISNLRALNDAFLTNLNAAASKAASTAAAKGADTDNCELPSPKRELLFEFVKRVLTGKTTRPRTSRPPCDPKKRKVPSARTPVAAGGRKSPVAPKLASPPVRRPVTPAIRGGNRMVREVLP